MSNTSFNTARKLGVVVLLLLFEEVMVIAAPIPHHTRLAQWALGLADLAAVSDRVDMKGIALFGRKHPFQDDVRLLGVGLLVYQAKALRHAIPVRIHGTQRP